MARFQHGHQAVGGQVEVMAGIDGAVGELVAGEGEPEGDVDALAVEESSSSWK